jgi:tRNA A37 threonylcarbamoyladenosine modification protein TsaB
MYLLIDLTAKDCLYLLLFDKAGKKKEKKVRGQNRDIVLVIDNLLKANNLTPNKIKGIAVVMGFGSFTSSRIAAVVANTFCYVLNIPVIGVEPGENDLKKLAEKFIKAKCKYLLPTYSGEPNIGN